MKSPFFLTLLLLLLAAPAVVAQDDSLSYEAEFEQWCQGRQNWLLKQDGYLSLVGLHWLSDKPQTFAGIGEAYLDGKDVVLKLEPGYTLDGKPVSEYRVAPEIARDTRFYKGDRHFYVNHHGSRVNLRVKDTNAPNLKNFAGVERFPLDPEWRIVARYEANKAAIPVTSVVDETIDEDSPGYAVFEWQGQTYKLRLMGEEADDSYFLVFSDSTAGKTTYQACRFLDVEKAQDGTLVLDFNRSWNPPCSMTQYATCPLPPAGNVLPFEVGAGELTYKGSSH